LCAFAGSLFGIVFERWSANYEERKWSREFLEKIKAEENIPLNLVPTPKLKQLTPEEIQRGREHIKMLAKRFNIKSQGEK